MFAHSKSLTGNKSMVTSNTRVGDRGGQSNGDVHVSYGRG